MIAEHDEKYAKEIIEFFKAEATKDPAKMDWGMVHRAEVIERLVNNLKIAEHSYRHASKEDKAKNYFTAFCEKCHWWGSSKYLTGGGPIADTGDYEPCCCPICGANEDNIDEKY